MTETLQATSVLELLSERAHFVEFAHPARNAHPNDRGPDAQRQYVLDKETWEELGCPKEITVTVVKGDVLNERNQKAD